MTRHANVPLVGVTVDQHDTDMHSERTYSLRSNYVDALTQAGAQAVLIPFDETAIDRYLSLCDGFVVTGTTPGSAGSLHRQAMDQAIVRRALAGDVPLLGICNGMQMMGIALGGRVIDVANGADAIDHAAFPVPSRIAHRIAIAGDGILAHIGAPAASCSVNSFHKQVLDRSGRYSVCATAPDGAIEAIEVPDHSFAVGVQWHPEYRITELDRCLLAAFVEACRARQSLRA